MRRKLRLPRRLNICRGRSSGVRPSHFEISPWLKSERSRRDYASAEFERERERDRDGLSSKLVMVFLVGIRCGLLF